MQPKNEPPSTEFVPRKEVMQKFRKKPVVIEAVRFTGNFQEIALWMKSHQFYGYGDNTGESPSDAFFVNTLEGTMRADIGDWIIRGVKGEFYPCKNDIFEATYEPVA
jgi:hypothetical protein